MVRDKYVKLPVELQDNKIPLWYGLFSDTFKSLKPSINIQIRVLNISHIYCFETVENSMYIIIHDLYITNKLIYCSDDNLFIYKKKNGTKKIILNFKSWLLSVSVNHLKQIRQNRNIIEYSLNIDDYENIFKHNLISYLESTEIEDKLDKLNDEDRLILQLFYLEDMPYKKIAEIFSKEGLGKFKPLNLRKKKQRALDKLRMIY